MSEKKSKVIQTIKTFAIILGVIALGIILIKWVVFPLLISIINFVVPNFWACIGYIFIIWIGYMIFRVVWTPIYSILGKWSYLIIIATIIYILMKIYK